jgi:hypothetical protein
MRSSLINDSKTRISEGIKNSPSYYQVDLNGSSIDVQIVDDSQVRDEKVLTTIYETPISSGSVVTWDSEKWIVVHFDKMGEIYKRCKIRKCLSTLKWLNTEGFVQEVDFTLASPTTTNFGVQDGRIISIGNERRQLVIPAYESIFQPESYWYYDQNGNPVYAEYQDGTNIQSVRKIKKNQRFIFDDRAWRVTALDKLTDGLITLTVEESEIDPSKDNINERIADYHGNTANFTIQIVNAEDISVPVSGSVQLSAEVRDNGVLVNKGLTWESSDTSIATVDSTGLVSTISSGSVIISAKLSSNPVIQDTISLSVQTVPQDNYSLSVVETTIVNVNSSKTFNSVVKNNGVPVTGTQVQWSIFADDGVSSTTKAAITSFNDTQCTLRGNSVGYVRLKMVLVDPNPSSSVTAFIRVQIKSLV